MAFQLIHDGYTRTATVRGGLSVRYRPLTGPQWFAALDWADKLDADKATEKTNDLLASCVLEWDAIDAAGDPAAINAASFAMLPAPTYTGLRNILTGWSEEGVDNVAATDQKNCEAG